jgi:hypothetical protein
MLAITLRFILLLLMLPVLPAFAEEGEDAGVDEHANAIYKCKDEQGRVAYTEKPCDDKAEAMQDLPELNQLPAVSGAEYYREDPPIETHKMKKQIQHKGSFQCDGRTRCSEMTSCEEAKFFLANCPNVKMDGRGEGKGGSGDGVPCESQWCNGE